MSCQHLAPNMRVVVTDAVGDEHHGVVTRGPSRKPGTFIKVWVRIDGRDDEIPWPVEAVRAEDQAGGGQP